MVVHVWVVAAIIFVSNLVPAWYLGIVHQRGVLDVMEPLQEISLKKSRRHTFVVFNALPFNTILQVKKLVEYKQT
ncbi:hypothetical protein NQ314_010997 [Rhamnusium bicolor]|uniref:Uncharacterized protein n=1 Tax=Rhamnusium bicolor TaxID=1586634 RepID=A0AAV8XN71_9CUCU|nr:hypothetical protein NQ314_010997 [Rhamnusium bicolor]